MTVRVASSKALLNDFVTSAVLLRAERAPVFHLRELTVLTPGVPGLTRKRPPVWMTASFSAVSFEPALRDEIRQIAFVRSDSLRGAAVHSVISGRRRSASNKTRITATRSHSTSA